MRRALLAAAGVHRHRQCARGGFRGIPRHHGRGLRAARTANRRARQPVGDRPDRVQARTRPALPRSRASTWRGSSGSLRTCPWTRSSPSRSTPARTRSCIAAGNTDPPASPAAQMSIPLRGRSMLAHGDVSADRFTEEPSRNPRRWLWLGACRCVPMRQSTRWVQSSATPSGSSCGPRVGDVLSGEAADRPGGPTRPLSDDVVRAKFFDLAGPLLGTRRGRDPARCGRPAGGAR